MIEMAGGAPTVARDLKKLGYVGSHGPYSEQAVRTWGTGAHTPSSDLLFALARYYELSLDRYAFSEPKEDNLKEAVREFQQRQDQLREALRSALSELVEADEACDTEFELSLDEYAFGEPEQCDLKQAVQEFQQRWAQLREALRQALREFVEIDELHGASIAPDRPASRPAGHARRHAVAGGSRPERTK